MILDVANIAQATARIGRKSVKGMGWKSSQSSSQGSYSKHEIKSIVSKECENSVDSERRNTSIKNQMPTSKSLDQIQILEVQKKKEHKLSKIAIEGSSEWPVIAEIVQRTCFILFPIMTLGSCSLILLFGFIRLHDFDSL